MDSEMKRRVDEALNTLGNVAEYLHDLRVYDTSKDVLAARDLLKELTQEPAREVAERMARQTGMSALYYRAARPREAVREARDWLLDAFSSKATAEICLLNAVGVVAAVEQHYEGGWLQFLRDGENLKVEPELEDEPDGGEVYEERDELGYTELEHGLGEIDGGGC